MEKIAEGKTKILWSTRHRNVIRVESKDDITAGNGARHDVIEGKGVFATTTTCNCFQLLWAASIPTHFGSQVDERSFLAHQVRMIPIEIVARRVADGSYLKRYPDTLEGTLFPQLVIEFFYKDDALHDPLLRKATSSGLWDLYDPKTPVSEASRLERRLTDQELFPPPIFVPIGLHELGQTIERVFLKLEVAWQTQGVRLLDMKIECGIGPRGDLLVADVIDNDSWRLWPRKDKQRYRDLPVVTAAALEQIKNDYAWVAEKTSRFVEF